ncbi:MAG TPA: plastocyanin/azurin family copper-binding protein, partial [Candidatus Binatia bacterium]|nr:plastocyanin/azurin family copper-binding protein [Candidatus Binatia bacterium]
MEHPRSTLAVVVAIGLVAGAALLPSPAGPAATAATRTVEARNYVFDPATLTIAPGDTVVWTFAGEPHTVTSGTSATDPELGEGFDSGLVEAGGRFEVTFTEPGTYRYICLVHIDTGMAGTIIVRAAVSPTPTPTPRPTPRPTPHSTPTPTPRSTPTPPPSPSSTPSPPAAASPPSSSPSTTPALSPRASLPQSEAPSSSPAGPPLPSPTPALPAGEPATGPIGAT